MNLIAIESSTEHLALAVARDGRITERVVHAGQRHAELLLDELDALLAGVQLAARDIDAVAFGAGPGSFTGLRIACGAAQGLALARGIPVLPVGCLEAVAEAAQADRVIVCLDARMGEVYHGAYVHRGDARWEQVCPPGLYSPGEAPLVTGGGWTGCGSGFAMHGAMLQQRYGAALAAVQPDVLPGAAAMLRLAIPRLLNKEGLDAAQAAPLYVRDKVALKTNER
jgi:tRNA threonylcarbamoyladenosine biosynthesis protein TsaB